jgi:hypothetical protein
MSVCLGSAKVCALRVARLADDCTAIPGSTNGAVSTAIVRLQSSPEYDTGQEFLQKNGCGDICLSLRDLDKLKRMTLQMELCTRDLELIEILTGATLYTVDGEVAGLARRGVGADDPAGVSLELWTRAIDTQGSCGVGGQRWWRWVYPRATFTLGDTTLENGIATVNLSGFAEPNAVWGNGPWNDWPASAFPDPDSPEHFVLDADGPPAAVCGYTTVPSGSGS